MKTNPEDIANWLAVETGHEADETDEVEKGEGAEESDEMPHLGLPNATHEKMRRFFDGLHVEKALTEKRRNDTMGMIDEAEKQNEALKSAIPPGGGI